VVDDAHRLNAAAIEALVGQAAVIAGNACVVLLVEAEIGARHPLAKLLAAGREVLAVEDFPARETPAAKPFALTESLGRRELGAALGALRDQLLAGREPLELFGLVSWQVQRWMAVRRMLDAGMPVQRIGSAAGMKPWQVERVRSEIAQRDAGSLQRMLERCWTLEVDAKIGRTTPQMALEQLVLEVCARPVPVTSRAS
jgi:hypothetical protein